MNGQELIEQAKARGFSLSERTLRYWVQAGLIPKPQRVSDGHRGGSWAIYEPEALDIACYLVELKGKTLAEKKKELDSLLELSYAPEYGLIKIVELLGSFASNGYLHTYRKMSDGSIIVTVKKRR